jgi:chromosome segregation ATPase
MTMETEDTCLSVELQRRTRDLYACRDRCVVLEKAAEDYRNAFDKAQAHYGELQDKVRALETKAGEYLEGWDASQAEVRRLDKKIVDLEAENRRLRDMRQQWLDRDRDNQIVIQTLKDVISDLR